MCRRVEDVEPEKLTQLHGALRDAADDVVAQPVLHPEAVDGLVGATQLHDGADLGDQPPRQWLQLGTGGCPPKIRVASTCPVRTPPTWGAGASGDVDADRDVVEVEVVDDADGFAGVIEQLAVQQVQPGVQKPGPACSARRESRCPHASLACSGDDHQGDSRQRRGQDEDQVHRRQHVGSAAVDVLTHVARDRWRRSGSAGRSAAVRWQRTPQSIRLPGSGRPR